ncbi:MAG: terpene cyclase/mutase family protein, partial [Actinobacteria bacterium]|nr:terpene cyclase/mutase family protein [Actinomycetota bacterium]
MSRARSVVVCFGALALGASALTSPAGATAPESQTTAQKAVEWLATQQQPDGGFEVSGFGGYETPDAVLALAEAAQTGSTWSAAEARTGVAALSNGTGLDALDALDAFAASGLNAGQAAKLIVLDAVPLGLDPAAFDPTGNGGPVDLTAIVDAGAQPDGTFGAFNATLYAALALRLTDGSVPAVTIQAITAAQQGNGSWNFAGDAAGTDVDPDTTGRAVEALVAGGVPPNDATITKALAFFAASQQADGAWPSAYDSGNPNSTALAIRGIVAAGFDSESSCWRDTVDAAKQGTFYPSPDEYLRSAQTAVGNIASPNDQWGLNTFPTSESVASLLRGWVPISRGSARTCSSATTTTTTVPSTTSTTVATQVQGATALKGATAARSTLPNTGTRSGTLALVGAISLATGGASQVVARR